MKARLPKESELALLYRLQSGEGSGDKVREVLGKLGIPFREISADMADWPLGACAGLPGYTAAPGTEHWEAPESEALIMAGLSSARVDAVLEGLRNAGARVRFKAVMTPHNRNWPFGKLLGELGREERMMELFMPMKKRLDRAKAMLPALPEARRPPLEAAVRRAAELADGKTEPTEERLRAADHALRTAMGENT